MDGVDVLESCGYVDHDKGQLGIWIFLSVRLQQSFSCWPQIEGDQLTWSGKDPTIPQHLQTLHLSRARRSTETA